MKKWLIKLIINSLLPIILDEVYKMIQSEINDFKQQQLKGGEDS